MSPGGSTHVFIVRWDSRTLLDQTDLTKGRDDSSKAVEEASRRGEQTLAARGQPTARGLASGVFYSVHESSRDASRGGYVSVFILYWSPSFSAYLKFTLENTEYTKLMEIVSLNPVLVCIHVLLQV